MPSPRLSSPLVSPPPPPLFPCRLTTHYHHDVQHRDVHRSRHLLTLDRIESNHLHSSCRHTRLSQWYSASRRIRVLSSAVYILSRRPPLAMDKPARTLLRQRTGLVRYAPDSASSSAVPHCCRRNVPRSLPSGLRDASTDAASSADVPPSKKPRTAMFFPGIIDPYCSSFLHPPDHLPRKEQND